MMNLKKYRNTNKSIFEDDINDYETEINNTVSKSSFLILGGAGTIGQAFVKEIFIRNPKKIHVVDISENNLTELVRDIRSSFGYIKGDFKTYTLDIESLEYDRFFMNDGKYDYVLNFSALKHVRSEKDVFTLMRMIKVNILNNNKIIKQSCRKGVKKYFCVSTDKAVNPSNMMGATKRVMELCLNKQSKNINISSARFANVAFSDGSLLYSFKHRMNKNQPIVSPVKIKRFFITPKESGELCLLSLLFANNNEFFFPKQNENLHPILLTQIALDFINESGFKPVLFKSEQEARENIGLLTSNSQWPCYFSESDTTGEKEIEEFYSKKEKIDLKRFKTIGVVKNSSSDFERLDFFIEKINSIKKKDKWNKVEIITLFKELLPDFVHFEKNKYLDDKM